MEISIEPVEVKYPEKRSSRMVSWEAAGAAGHDDRLLISKLKPTLLVLALPLLLVVEKLLEPEAGVAALEVSLEGGVKESKVEVKDMNMGLLAIVVYGELEAKPVLAPKPKSICMAPSVAVG